MKYLRALYSPHVYPVHFKDVETSLRVKLQIGLDRVVQIGRGVLSVILLELLILDIIL